MIATFAVLAVAWVLLEMAVAFLVDTLSSAIVAVLGNALFFLRFSILFVLGVLLYNPKIRFYRKNILEGDLLRYEAQPERGEKRMFPIKGKKAVGVARCKAQPAGGEGAKRECAKSKVKKQ